MKTCKGCIHRSPVLEENGEFSCKNCSDFTGVVFVNDESGVCDNYTRNLQQDLETCAILKTKDWFNRIKGNMDLVEIIEHAIKRALTAESGGARQ